MSETDVNHQVRRAVEALGGVLVRVQTGQFRGAGGIVQGAKRGTPDHVALMPGGRCVWLESKVGDASLSALQLAWAAKAERLGHRVERVTCAADVVRALGGAL